MTEAMQHGISFLGPYFSMYFPEDCFSGKTNYFDVANKIKPGERHLNILVCGAGAAILEFPLLLSLLQGRKTANIIFIDKNVEPYRLLEKIFKNYLCKSKALIKQEYENIHTDVTINEIQTTQIAGCFVTYSLFVRDLELNPNPQQINFINQGSLDGFNDQIRHDYSDFIFEIIQIFNSKHPKNCIGKNFDVVTMSQFLHHISFWRSLIAYLNYYLAPDGVFLINEFDNEDYMFGFNLNTAIVTSPSEHLTQTDYKKFFDDLFIHRLSIISDNHELCVTNIEVYKHFFEFFSTTLEQTNSLELSYKFTKQELQDILTSNHYSSYQQYYALVDASAKEKIKSFFSKVPDSSVFVSTTTIKWTICKKIDDSRISHFNPIPFSETDSTHLSTKDLQRYITEFFDVLSSNTTIFSVLQENCVQRDGILSVLFDLLSRLFLFKIENIAVETLVVLFNDIEKIVLASILNNSYCTKFDTQKQVFAKSVEYNSLLKNSGRVSNSEQFFNVYKNVFVKPFVVIFDHNTKLSPKYTDDEIVNGLHIITLRHNNIRTNEPLLKTKLCDDLEKCRENIFYSFNLNATSMPNDLCVIVPSFDDKLTIQNTYKKEVTASFIIAYQQKNATSVKNTLLPFFSWLIKKITTFSSFSRSVDLFRFTANIRQESLKSAVAAIMSRNMSHNLGSHVVTNAKHQIMELEQRQGDEGVREQLKGVSALLQYLQERQDFIAVIANDEHYPKGALNFKSAVFDMIAMDGPSRRHDPDNEKNNEGKINNYILDNIIRSEDVVRAGSIAAREEEGALKIELELVKVDATGRAVAFKSLDQTHRIGNEFSDITLSVNNGLNGRQAFLTILENLIRNSAKHNKEALKHLGDDNTLLFSIIFKESGNGYDITICDNKRDFAVAKKSMEGENAGILREGRLAPLRILREDGGGISRENKGYKEMLICLAWLKHGENIGAGGVREISYETLQNTPWELMDVVGVDHAHDYKVYGHDDPNPPPDLSLGHRFHIAKHKMIHLITPDELAGEGKGIFERLSELPSATLYAVRQSDHNRDPDNAVLVALPRLEVVPDSETEEGLRDKSATLYERNVRRRFTAKLAAGGSLPPLRISGEATRNYHDFDARVVVRDDLGASADRAWEEAHGGEMFVHFRTHYETRLDDAIEAGKRGDADAVAKLAPAPGAFYTEGISGGNFTNTLIRTDIDRFAYCGIVEAALAQIAIVDERVFARCQGVTPKQREAANGAVPENPRWRHWEQLGIHVLNNDENGIFDLRGYYISSGAKSGMVYDFLSIHLGLIDKQTEEKTQAKIATERARLEAALEQFGDRYQAGRTRLSVHSGRGGMTEMGEKIAFFPLSGIEWALDNCKYVLSDFFHGLKYPVFGEVPKNSAAKAEPLERDAVPFGGRASPRAASVDVADARGKVPTLPQREKWRSPFARVNGQECGFSNPQKDYADRNVRTPFATTIQTHPTHRKIFLVTTYHFDKGYAAGAAVDTGLAPEIGQFAAWDKIQSEMRDFAGHFTRITHIDETVFFYPCAKPRRVVVPPHRHGDFICHLVEKILGTHGSKDGRPIELHLVLHASDDGERRITNHYDAQSPLVERIRREHPGVASVGVWWFSHDGSGIHGNVLGDNRLFHGAASAEEKAWVLLRKLAEHASVKLPESAGVSGSAGLPSRIETRILGRAKTPRSQARTLFHTLRIPDHVRLNRRTYLNRLAIWQLRGSDDQEALDTIFEPSGDDRDFWNPKFSPDDCASRLVAPRPLLVMGAKPLEVFGEKEQRANYLDNSIWCRYAASEEEAAAIRAEFERYDALGLYQSDVGKEYLEFTARSCVNSQFAEFSKSGHSQVVPIVFHSEGELRAKAGQHLADIRENYKGQLPLTWKILLIDDHVETPLAGAGISKLEVICKALEPLFSITIVKGGAEPPGDAPKKDLNILLHCVDTLDGAKELVVKNRYDMLFLDYLFSDSKETSDTFLRDLDQMAGANPTICGPFGQFWIFNVSAFAYALDRKLLAIGLSYHTKHWEFARGACAVNNPELFKHNLLAFMKTQLDRLTTLPSQELGGRKIITLLDLLRMIYMPGENPRVRNQAVLHLQDVLSCQSDYERMLRDITHGLEKCAADLVHIQNNPCKSEIVHTLFPDIPYYNKAFWDHLTSLVQLTASGLPQQWPGMLMRFNAVKQILLDANTGPCAREARELVLAIENYIISLHPPETRVLPQPAPAHSPD